MSDDSKETFDRIQKSFDTASFITTFLLNESFRLKKELEKEHKYLSPEIIFACLLDMFKLFFIDSSEVALVVPDKEVVK